MVLDPSHSRPQSLFDPLPLLALIGVVAAVWEFLPRVGLVPRSTLPTLSESLLVLFQDRLEYCRHLKASLQAMGLAMLIVSGVGMAAGLIIGSLAGARRGVVSLLESLYAVPLVMFYPLLVAWLSVGIEAKVALASMYGLIPCVLGTVAGVQALDRQYLQVARSLRATWAQTVLRVLLPALMPTFMYSLRVGGSLVIVGVVVAEMLISTDGLGHLIARSQALLDSPRVFAGVLTVLGLIFVLNLCLVRLARVLPRK